MDSAQLMQEAHFLLLEQQNEAAYERIRKVLSDEPLNDRAIILLARYHFNGLNYNDGIQCIRDAISISDKEDYYHYLLAFGLYQINAYEEARLSIQKAISLSPYIGAYFGLHALICVGLFKNDDALLLADEGLAIEPNDIDSLHAKSVALQRLGRKEESIHILHTLLTLDKSNLYAHHTLGWNYIEKGIYKQASDHFKICLDLDPSDHTAKIGLKESLKSSLILYRWALQYSLWLRKQHAAMRWVLPLLFFFTFRTLLNTSKGSTFTFLSMSLLLIYVLIVLSSWLIPHMANYYLLYHPTGKFVLDRTEKYTAQTVVYGFSLGIVICLAILFIPENAFTISLGITGLSLIVASFISGSLQYPIRFSIKSKFQIFTLILIGLSIVASFVGFIDHALGGTLIGVAMIGFLVHNWIFVIKR